MAKSKCGLQAFVWGDRVTRSASHLRATRRAASFDPTGATSGGPLIGGDGGGGTFIADVPGCETLIFVLWDEETECHARAIHRASVILSKDIHLDAMRAEHQPRPA